MVARNTAGRAEERERRSDRVDGDTAAGPDDAADAQLPPPQTCQPPPREVPAGLEGLPQRLSETGCFQAGPPLRPVSTLISYDVNVPLWSDGADKDRWLALPDGERIAIGADGDFAFPAGTVLIKTFRLGTQPVETRFFVRHPDGEWSGYTYGWNDDGTDATLLDEGSHHLTVAGRAWYAPSRAECSKCHTEPAGYALGLELAQLDREVTTSDGGHENQLAALAKRGLFADPLPALVAALPALNNTGAPLDQRARAYLHANCANCHRPGVGNSGATDFRFDTPLGATMTCDVVPLKGSLGYGSQMRIIAPASPDKSMLIVRMRELGSGRMPPMASAVVDETAVALLSDWITGLATCP